MPPAAAIARSHSFAMTPVKTVTSSEKPENVGLPPTPGPEVDINLTGPDVKPQKEEPAPKKEEVAGYAPPPLPSHVLQNPPRRPAMPPTFDSLGEVSGRFEAHLLVPVVSYPLINWRTALVGTGQTLQPITLIERQTGAAILLKTLKRSVIRRSNPLGGMYQPGFMGNLPAEISPEFRRLEEALKAVQNPSHERGSKPFGQVQTNQLMGGTGAPPSVDASNRPLYPDTPKPDQNARGKLLPGNGMASEPIQGMSTDVMTPQPLSPTTEGPGNLPAALEQGQASLPKPKEASRSGEKTEKQGGDYINKGKPDQRVMISDSVPPPPPGLLPSLPTGAPPMMESQSIPSGEDIGLHCWVIATLQEEVDQAVKLLQELFEAKIAMFEEWAKENEFDPAWFDQQDEETKDDEDGDDEPDAKRSKRETESDIASPAP